MRSAMRVLLPCVRLAAVLAILAALGSGLPKAAQAQEPVPAQPAGEASPDSVMADAVAAVVEAFERLAARAAEGDWQAADAAFNDVLDALDAYGPMIESSLGEAGVAALARLDPLLDALAAGLDGEDAVAVQAGAARAVAEVTGLLPSAGVPAEAELDLTVVDWRARVDAILALGEAGAWRDMRNAAMDLAADVSDRGPAVTRLAGTSSAPQVDVLRVFAMRLRMAALDQSLSDARTAAGFAIEALDALSGLPAPSEGGGNASPATGVTARVYQVRGELGSVLVVPVVLEGVPQIGLGATTVEIGWGPTALRLVDVSWDVGAGTLVRDDEAGRVDLSLPPAPVGPSGDVILARLRFEVMGDRIDARDYLPRDTVTVLESASASAREWVRAGDTPRASAALASAYAALMAGRGEPDSLYAQLERDGLIEALRLSLLRALELATQPAETDRIVVALREWEARMSATWAAHLAGMGGSQGVPITILVQSMYDTAGGELPVRESLPGLVLFSEGVVRMGTAGPADGARIANGTPSATGQPRVETVGPTPGAPDDATAGATEQRPASSFGEGDGSADTASPTRGLVPLTVALAAAALTGLGATAFAEREERRSAMRH